MPPCPPHMGHKPAPEDSGLAALSTVSFRCGKISRNRACEESDEKNWREAIGAGCAVTGNHAERSENSRAGQAHRFTGCCRAEKWIGYLRASQSSGDELTSRKSLRPARCPLLRESVDRGSNPDFQRRPGRVRAAPEKAGVLSFRPSRAGPNSASAKNKREPGRGC